MTIDLNLLYCPPQILIHIHLISSILYTISTTYLFLWHCCCCWYRRRVPSMEITNIMSCISITRWWYSVIRVLDSTEVIINLTTPLIRSNGVLLLYIIDKLLSLFKFLQVCEQLLILIVIVIYTVIIIYVWEYCIRKKLGAFRSTVICCCYHPTRHLLLLSLYS